MRNLGSRCDAGDALEIKDSHGNRHPSPFEPAILLPIVILCVFGAVIGTQLLVSLGLTANTSIIGALFAMALGRVPMGVFLRYRSIHVQNLVQTALSSATFGAGNSLLLPIGIPFVLGRPDLVLPMFVGAALAMLLDAYLLYRLFDSRIFPGSGAWAPGIAAAETIKAGDQGGHKARLMAGGVALGAVGAIFKIPMSAFGVAFIGNIWALSMFGIGLLLRGYSDILFDNHLFAAVIPRGDLMEAYVPHGFMIGAGLVALVQVVLNLARRSKADRTSAGAADTAVRRVLSFGVLAYIAIAIVLALMGGIITEMSPGMFLLFIAYAAFTAYAHELIVGLAAMHSGWFPAFAVALVTLITGMLIGFPVPALALLVGFSAATGPAFADMGYDLKAGYMLRGNGTNPGFEREGRRQQLLAAMIAFVIAAIVVWLTYPRYFEQNLVAPVDRVYVATIIAGVAPGVSAALAVWALPGAALQFLGGQKRQIGVLFATGLLIDFSMAGWAVMAGILCRLIWRRLRPQDDGEMEVFAAGAIAGDAVFSFCNSLGQYMHRR